MNRAQLEASRALWKRRYGFRLRRWHYYHKRATKKNPQMTGRRKWWGLLEEAREQIQHREAQLARLPKPKPSSRSRALAWYSARLGIHETGGANRGPLIDRWERVFGFLGAPWCGIAAGNALLAAGVHGVTSRIASVSAIESDARFHRGPFMGWSGNAHGAQPGDLVTLFSPGEHVEMIRHVYSDGSVDTYGGNASNSVKASHRSASEIVGVAHVRYP